VILKELRPRFAGVGDPRSLLKGSSTKRPYPEIDLGKKRGAAS
jgi:hypothetical protein